MQRPDVPVQGLLGKGQRCPDPLEPFPILADTPDDLVAALLRLPGLKPRRGQVQPRALDLQRADVGERRAVLKGRFGLLPKTTDVREPNGQLVEDGPLRDRKSVV